MTKASDIREEELRMMELFWSCPKQIFQSLGSRVAKMFVLNYVSMIFVASSALWSCSLIFFFQKLPDGSLLGF